MVEVNFNDITEEELKYFQEEFIKIFEKVFENIKMHKEFFESHIDKNKTSISGVNLTVAGKIALIAKKFAINTIISHITGIEPMFLDSDTSFLRKDNNAKMQYYMKCDIKKLMYNVVCDLYNGLEELLKRLKTDNMLKLKKVLASIDDFERHNYNFEDVNNLRGQKLSYESKIYPLLIRENILNIDQYNRCLAMCNRKYKLDMPIKFIDEINDVYDRYKFNIKRK